MITGELKNKIDSLWDRFHSGGVANPLSVIEQITYLLFIKRLDELQKNKENLARHTKAPIENPIFKESEQHLRWSEFKDLEAEQMFDLVRTEVFDFMKNMGNPDAAFTRYMKNAYLAIPTPVVLEQVVSMIEGIPMHDRDTKGDVYEYMLSKIATSGDNGQFRTPRHIARLMADLMKPGPEDIICDPACGSGGFLVAAGEYIHEHYEDHFYQTEFTDYYSGGMFHGCEFDDTMIRIAAMNLMLHGVENPDLYDKSSLDEEYKEEDCFSLILANPPFKGSLDKNTVAKSLSRMVDTRKTELLFLALMVRLLKVGGRCATIVPDGVLFGNDKGAKGIRQQIIDKQKLEAIISMPGGVFKPYAGVSTAIVIFTKTGNGGTDKVWFYDMRADGFTLNDKRTPTTENDLPDIKERWNNLAAEANRSRTDQSFFVPVEEIREKNYDLSINKYKEVIYEEKEYDSPTLIFTRLNELDQEIEKVTQQLKALLEEK